MKPGASTAASVLTLFSFRLRLRLRSQKKTRGTQSKSSKEPRETPPPQPHKIRRINININDENDFQVVSLPTNNKQTRRSLTKSPKMQPRRPPNANRRGASGRCRLFFFEKCLRKPPTRKDLRLILDLYFHPEVAI